MKEIMCTHLAKRGSVYYYRRKTPTELISIFGKEIMKSLGTKDRRQAEVLVRKLGTQYDELFQNELTKAAEQHNNVASTPAHSPIKTKPPAWDVGLTVHDSELYAAKYLKRLRVSREQSNTNGTLDEFNAALDNLIADGNEYFSTGEHPFEENPREIWKLESKLVAATALKRNKHLAYQELNVTEVKPANPITSTYLNTLIDKWALSRQPTPRTIAMTKSIVEKFDSITGLKVIGEITKHDIVAFKDYLLTNNYSIPNAKKYLTMIKTLLNFAIGEALLDISPAQGVILKDKKSPKSKRLPFDLQSLNKIFASPIYAEAHRPSGGKGEASYWVPLIALFTGARLNEICQITTQDIVKTEYVDNNDNVKDAWVIYITNEGEGQEVKNNRSKRRVPIHNDLIELGFIKYLNTLPKASNLFPELTTSISYNSISANWSKWFNRYLRTVIGVTDTRMVFHSFRHCFKDYARDSGIPNEVHHAITGHSSGNVGDNYGSDKYPMRPLVESMAKYKVTGLSLPKPVLQP